MDGNGGQSMRLGFIGTGTITAAMVRGLKGSPLKDWPVILSPRNADLARGLADSLPGVTVAISNQAVIDAADMVVLAVRPQVAEQVLRGLVIRAHQPVISLVAATSADQIAGWTGARQICRAIPLPFVEQRCDVTPVFPALPAALQLFDALGAALPVQDQPTFDLYAALSALMGSYFGLLETSAAWAINKGLPAPDARVYLAGLFHNLGKVAQGDPRSLDDLRRDHSTAGGLNEQVFVNFARQGGTTALTDALDGVLRRIKGAS